VSSIDEFENLVRGYRVVLGGLNACSEDICVKCLNLESAKLKATKGLKKLEMDMEKSSVSEEEKKQMSTKIEGLSEIAEGIPLEQETSCQKTAGLCKLGTPCLATDLLKLITQ
jgi:hypothetical protein